MSSNERKSDIESSNSVGRPGSVFRLGGLGVYIRGFLKVREDINLLNAEW